MERVCIVGAGPAGLSAARAFRRLGIEYDQFERHSDVGGIWDLDNPGTPMYESAHFISSRTMSGFYDFPMPVSFADYPGNRQILDYTRSFARAYGLYDGITFETSVDEITPEGDGWSVRVSTGERRRYRAVVCATGVTWQPRIPAHPGTFDGEVRHAVSYRSIDEFRGKRVLIVGLGNSGADIACDAAVSAAETYVSVRRGYHVIPKHIFGTPTDVFAEKGPRLPLVIERPLLTGMLRLLQGDLTRLGLPRPDHKLLESHPLLNSQLVHHLQHGDVSIVPDVSRLAGPRVQFTDGSSREIDLVLYATGYDWAVPYVPDDCFDWAHGRPRLYLTAFNPRQRNLFGVGYLETNSSAYTLFDQVTNVLAHYLHDQWHDPVRAEAFERKISTDRPDLSGGISFIGTDRHSAYVDAHAFRDYLARIRSEFGWTDLEPGMFHRVRVTA
ncbi:4-hydroxyacetophenone monooxygenase [Rhodococcus sp. Br-6]|uniref:flavin-containing monooxygenase n=1 Tax=Rhodococcus hoagii TaxID=43767 RepID=UPI000852EBEA|nr:NAD(P)-binding domain-containing protein [Prescottella equi]MBU4614008.1 NAD(P)-binding domain-containing protein [Rhodococcus sp. GG48]WJJ13972.1 NAD(P)-binding domain-containing protein [Prescottella equi]BCN59055.1 flavin-binding monooxygenase [Prescottella equi]GBF15331.1 4-hydroxyacetophenone monooxygenase [Rhodococcus sp. Br-6]